MEKQNHLWIIDAGHAPRTPGKRSPVLDSGRCLFEWEFNRSIVTMLRAILDERGIAHHELVPRTNRDMPAYKRADMANDVAARCGMPGMLVSIHGNAHGRGREFTPANGVATLHYPSPYAQTVAQTFQKYLVAETGWRDRGTKERAGLAMLRRTKMPSVLTESGFYTNEVQCAEMLSIVVRERIAMAHANAITEIEGKAQ